MRYLLSICLLILSSVSACAVSISLSPILDWRKIDDQALCFRLRNEVVVELIQNYDCVVLSRTNGTALLEEQRLQSLELVDPSMMPYPAVADFFVQVFISNDGDSLAMKVSCVGITNAHKGEFKSDKIRFNDREDFEHRAISVLVEHLAKKLQLTQRKEMLPTSMPGGMWAVLPWQDLNASEDLSSSMLSELLMDSAYEGLMSSVESSGQIQDLEKSKSVDDLWNGATSLAAATVGVELGAKHVVYGTVAPHGDGLEVVIFVVRVVDAAILEARSLVAPEMATALQATKTAVVEMVSSMPALENLSRANQSERVAEARHWLKTGSQLYNNRKLSAEVYAGTYMVAQDTYLEDAIMDKFSYSIHWHPAYWIYTPDVSEPMVQWQESHNEYVLGLMVRLAGDPMPHSQKLRYARALTVAGKWGDAATIFDEAFEESISDSLTLQFVGEYLVSLVNTNQVTKADQLISMIPDEFWVSKSGYGDRLRKFTAQHYRRIGDYKQEMVMLTQRAELNWSSEDGAQRFTRYLLDNQKPDERIRLLEKMYPRVGSQVPYMAYALAESYYQLGQHDASSNYAEILLHRKKLGSLGYESVDELRERLKVLAGADIGLKKWSTAREIQSIPDQYRMYLQPVGDFDLEIVQESVDRASKFFGCDFVIRPSIPIPEQGAIRWSDSTNFLGVPLLRRFSLARPAPEDGIYLVYLINSRFLSAGYKGDMYQSGLGAMLSYEMSNLYAKNREQTIVALSNMIIRQFHFFIEDTQAVLGQNISCSLPCINAKAVTRETVKFGYCASCHKYYAQADMGEVKKLTQSFPAPSKVTDHVDSRFPVDDRERKSIEAYVEALK